MKYAYPVALAVLMFAPAKIGSAPDDLAPVQVGGPSMEIATPGTGSVIDTPEHTSQLQIDRGHSMDSMDIDMVKDIEDLHKRLTDAELEISILQHRADRAEDHNASLKERLEFLEMWQTPEPFLDEDGQLKANEADPWHICDAKQVDMPAHDNETPAVTGSADPLAAPITGMVLHIDLDGHANKDDIAAIEKAFAKKTLGLDGPKPDGIRVAPAPARK